MTKELINFLFGSLLALVGVIIGGILATSIWRRKKKQFFLIGFLFYLVVITGCILVKFTKLLWIGYSVPLFFGLVLLWVSLRNFRVTFLMVRLIKKRKFLEAIRIGEREIKQGNDIFAIKINLISAYYYNGNNIDKALFVIESVDVSKLSSYDKKLLDDWKIKVEESLKK